MQPDEKRAVFIVEISHPIYRHFLDEAVEVDRRFPWLSQHKYLLDIASVNDDAVWLKPSMLVSKAR